jgi:hypothetical protein
MYKINKITRPTAENKYGAILALFKSNVLIITNEYRLIRINHHLALRGEDALCSVLPQGEGLLKKLLSFTDHIVKKNVQDFSHKFSLNNNK